MFQFHDDAMNQSVVARSTMETGLRQGMAHNQILLHYRPVVACASGSVAALEAQLYWRHPGRGLLPASEFVPASDDLSVVRVAADALWSQRIGADPELRPGDEAAAGALRRWSLLA